MFYKVDSQVKVFKSNIARWVFISCGLFSLNSYGSDQIIEVRGHRKNEKSLSSGGVHKERRLLVEKNPSILGIFSEETSFRVEETGQPDSFHYQVPSIRGSEPKSTLVFVDHISFKDEYTGLPDSRINLSLFEKMDIFFGISPYNIPSTSVVGGYRFRLKDQKQSYHQYYLSKGDVGGWQGHLIQRSYKEITDSWKLITKFTVSRQSSRGDYEYYDNAGVPFSKEHHSYKRRVGNDVSSNSLGAYVYLKSRFSEFSYLNQTSIGKGGIPNTGQHQDHERRSWGNHHHHLNFTHKFNSTGLLFPDSIELSLPFESINQQKNAQNTRYKSSGLGQVLNMHWNKRRQNKLFVQISDKKSMFYLESDFLFKRNLSRDKKSFFFGSQTPLFNLLELESKIEGSTIVDYNQDSEIKNEYFGWNLNLFKRGQIFTSYMQFGRQLKPPTVFESFGDGLRVIPGSDLKNETVWHGEAGVKRWRGRHEYGISVFVQHVDNKISLVPTVAQKMVSVNLERAEIRGVNLWYEGSLAFVKTRANYFYQDASFIELQSKKFLPRAPKNKFYFSLSKKILDIDLSIAGRYRSELFLDKDNLRYLPSDLVFDAQMSYEYRKSLQNFGVGLCVRNIENKNRFSAFNFQTSQYEGTSGRQDIYGLPLPGRTVELQLYAKI